MSSLHLRSPNDIRKTKSVSLYPADRLRRPVHDLVPAHQRWTEFLATTRVLDILRPDYYLIFRFHDACQILHQENISLDLGGQPVHYESLMRCLPDTDLRFIRTADQLVIQLIRERKLEPFDLTYRIGSNVACDNTAFRRMLRTCMLIHTGPDVMTGLMCFHNVTQSVSGLRAHGVELSCRPGLEYLQGELKDRLSLSLPLASLVTPRELEIIACLRRGMSSKQIAAALFIAKNTVDTHRQNMLRKWGLPNTAALLQKAMDEGWG